MTKKKTASDDLLEFARKSGLARRLELSNLRDAVIRDQHTVEEKLEGVAALEWPNNILARMHYALERDDFDEITTVVAEWHAWIANIPPDVGDILYRTVVRIEAYVEQYRINDTEADTGMSQ